MLGVRLPRRARPARKAGPLRIVLVEQALDDDGAVRVSLDRASRWAEAGASVTVFVAEPGGRGTKVVVPEDLEVRHGTAVLRRFRWTFLVGLVRLVLLGSRADVLVSGREIGVGLLQCVAAGRILRRPVAVTVQSRADIAIEEYVGEQLRAWTAKALVRADLLVPVSTGMLPTLVELGISDDRVRPVTNGVDVDHIRLAAQQAPDVVLPPGRFVMGSGRLHRQKGFDLLLRAHASALRDGAPPHHLVLVGDGPDREALHELVAELEVGDSVLFTGFVANPHAIVTRADVFVLPSRWEGYPLALVEAICCATPCIATSCVSGPEEVLDGGRFGALVRPEDPVELAAALRRHLDDPTSLREGARVGAAEASGRFDAGRAARAHLQLLEELCAAPVIARGPRTCESPQAAGGGPEELS